MSIRELSDTSLPRESSYESGFSDEEDDGFSDRDPERLESNGHAIQHFFFRPICGLLVCVPLAIILQLVGDVDHKWRFFANFGAIVPLSWMIGASTEHLEHYVGATIGALLNSSFGNAVEILLSLSALNLGKIKLVQSTMLGSILGNLLFVLGGCFIVASRRSAMTKFNANSATYNLSLLSVSVLALVVPTGLAAFDEFSTTDERLNLSRAVGLLLGFMYLQWLYFALSTHSGLFDTPSPEPALGNVSHEIMENGDEKEPILPAPMCMVVLFSATALVAFHCDWLVESIDPLTEELGVKKAFVATVLLPLVGNFSEIMAAFGIAGKGKLDLAMAVAIGAATQIALLVVPITVLVGWVVGQPMDLDFEVFQVKLLLVSMLIVTLSLQDGYATWLKGSLLVTTYAIVAMSFWFMHDREFDAHGVGGTPRSDNQI